MTSGNFTKYYSLLSLAFSSIRLYNFSMSQISILYRLQLIDSQLDAAISSMRVTEKELADNLQVLLAQQNVSQADEYFKNEGKRLKDAENKTYDTRIKIELAEASLYGGKIHNPKELTELQSEVASLRRLMISLEDHQLEVMMSMEEAEQKLMWANKELLETQARQIEQHANLNGEKQKLSQQIERLESERKATLSPISAADLGLYEQLRKARNGVAVVKITSRACDACGTTLTPALVQSVQSTGQLVRCPTCGRILYFG